MNYGNPEKEYLTPQQREALIQYYLGKTVEVEIDRPIGFVHVTKGVTLRYTVNYGYLPGVMGGDGEEQDVYILGVDEPASHFTGRIIAAIRRTDDNEDKLVAAPEGVLFHQGQIAEKVHFVEQYFESSVDAIYQKSCGVIPYRENGDVLLLRGRKSGFWSFPKGHMEAWEEERDTACRELREESGLTARLLPGFRATLEYRVSAAVRKEVVLFLGAVTGEPVLDGKEIMDSRWAAMEEAQDLLGAVYAPALKQVERCIHGKGDTHA